MPTRSGVPGSRAEGPRRAHAHARARARAARPWQEERRLRGGEAGRDHDGKVGGRRPRSPGPGPRPRRPLGLRPPPSCSPRGSRRGVAGAAEPRGRGACPRSLPKGAATARSGPAGPRASDFLKRPRRRREGARRDERVSRVAEADTRAVPRRWSGGDLQAERGPPPSAQSGLLGEDAPRARSFHWASAEGSACCLRSGRSGGSGTPAPRPPAWPPAREPPDPLCGGTVGPIPGGRGCCASRVRGAPTSASPQPRLQLPASPLAAEEKKEGTQGSLWQPRVSVRRRLGAEG